jgi:hypothetical protein
MSVGQLVQGGLSTLGRPTVDTLNGSAHANMKELRFYVDNGVWRIAFAFDPQRKAILLVGRNKSGVNERRFYKQLISDADARFDAHLRSLKAKRGVKKEAPIKGKWR